jgi:hypothetical protein
MVNYTEVTFIILSGLEKEKAASPHHQTAAPARWSDELIWVVSMSF